MIRWIVYHLNRRAVLQLLYVVVRFVDWRVRVFEQRIIDDTRMLHEMRERGGWTWALDFLESNIAYWTERRDHWKGLLKEGKVLILREGFIR